MKRLVAHAGMAALLLACAGGPPPEGTAVCPPDPDPAIVAATSLATPAAGDAANGAVLFERECTRCHSAELSERGSRFFVEYPRLDCSEYVAKAPPGYLYTAIAEGGVAVGRDELMKPFRELLTEQEIADLVAYLRDGV